MSKIAEELEPVVLAAWPAEEIVEYDGWLLRASRGVTSRGNSVLANNHHGAMPLLEKIETAESFYRTRNLPPKFQLNPLTQPTELEAVLNERDYQLVDDVLVKTVVLPTESFTYSNSLTLNQSHTLTEQWLQFHQSGNSYDDHQFAVRKAIMKQIKLSTLFVTAAIDSQVVGIGSAVSMNGWLGIYNMRTANEYKKKGIGTAVVANLLNWGIQQNLKGAYLQVTATNQPAHALYQKFGFTTAYNYKHLAKK